MKNQTAVEWLIEQLTEGNYNWKVYDQAKEMEKEQIVNSYRDGRSDQQSDRQSIFYNRMAENYYNETFNK